MRGEGEGTAEEGDTEGTADTHDGQTWTDQRGEEEKRSSGFLRVSRMIIGASEAHDRLDGGDNVSTSGGVESCRQVLVIYLVQE